MFGPRPPPFGGGMCGPPPPPFVGGVLSGPPSLTDCGGCGEINAEAPADHDI